MAAETGFDIDGVIYPIPELASLDMDEAQVLYDYSGLAIDDFVPPADDAEEDDREAYLRKIKNPGLIRAYLHIAYQRGNPKAKPSIVRDVVKNANMVQTYTAFIAAGEEEAESGDEVPPASTSEQPGQSPSDSLENNNSNEKKAANGGQDSTSDSAGQDSHPVTIGVGR